MAWSEFSFILKSSKLGGIGVFAAHNMVSGTHIFLSSFELRVLQKKEIPVDFLKYCIYINDEEVIGPERFDRMEIGWFINHSSEPNIEKRTIIRNAGALNIADIISDMKVLSMFTIKDIKSGDEILIDYNQLTALTEKMDHSQHAL